jgi:hypothetical protein
MHAYGTKHLPSTSRNHHYQKDPKGGVDSMVSFGLGGFLMWDGSCLDRYIEMLSAFIEVRAIREDLNARRRKGEQPENKFYESALYRWQDAIAAFARTSPRLAECLYSRQTALLVAALPPADTNQLAKKGAGSARSDFNHGGSLSN